MDTRRINLMEVGEPPIYFTGAELSTWVNMRYKNISDVGKLRRGILFKNALKKTHLLDNPV